MACDLYGSYLYVDAWNGEQIYTDLYCGLLGYDIV
jgi:hypothetical protein